MRDPRLDRLSKRTNKSRKQRDFLLSLGKKYRNASNVVLDGRRFNGECRKQPPRRQGTILDFDATDPED
jgi:hypothetical protein